MGLGSAETKKQNKIMSVRAGKVKSAAGAFFERIVRAAGRAWQTLWNFMCRNKSFARFAYVTFPVKRRKFAEYIGKKKKKIIIPAVVCIAALAVMLGVTLKDTENADYLAAGNDTDYAMVLQNYSTFDHSQPTHVALRLSWDDGAIDLNNGKAEAKIKAKVYPVNLDYESIEWKSSDEEMVKIDKDGKITAAEPGEVKITANIKNIDSKLHIVGKTDAKASLSVRQPVSGIFLPTSTVTMYTNGAGRLISARVFPENASNKNVTWKSKNTKIASVDSDGRIRAVGVGMTEVIATTEDGGYEGRCFVNVVNPSVNVETLSLKNESDMRIKVGDSINAVMTVSPSNARNKTLKWSSDNTDVATVSQTGRIKGVGEGSAQITAESANGVKQTFTVLVGASDGKDPFDLLGDPEFIEANGTITYTPYDISFPQAVRIQMSQNPPPKIWGSGGLIYASEAQTIEYMNPNSYYMDAYKYQFLDLSRSNGVSAERLNEYLADKGILRGTGEAFVEAARRYNVSEVYLVAHACLESGNGTSQLSTGVDVNGTTVYNVFGIAAYDSSPLYGGSQKAYKEGWTSVEAAIKGGAEWISRYYINSADGRQNTLYKMLWNPENPGTHQYATDIGWAVKQAVSIEKIFASFDGVTLSFDIPVYNGQIPPVIEFE